MTCDNLCKKTTFHTQQLGNIYTPPPTEILATRLAQAYTLLKYAECRPGDMFLPFAADAYGVYLY